MDKKKFIGLSAAAMMIAAGTAISVNVSTKESNLSDVYLANIEALADNEKNPWWLWPIDGLTKDEKPRDVDCERQIGIPPYVEIVQGKKQVCDDGGSENCSTSLCKP
jgi:hypothetical protein